MATTHQIRSVGAAILDHDTLSYVALFEPEGSNETFTAGAPVVAAAGLLVEATDPVGATLDVLGLAIQDASDLVKGRDTLTKFLPAIDGVIFHANFLTGDGLTNTFAETNLFEFGVPDLSKKTGLITAGVDDWFIDEAGLGNSVTVVSTRADIIPVNLPEREGSRIIVGDIDARVGFVFIQAARAYGS